MLAALAGSAAIAQPFEWAAWKAVMAAELPVEAGYAEANAAWESKTAAEKLETAERLKAARWFRLAGEQGATNGQLALGVIYATGRGVAEDLVESFAWFNIAEAQGDTSARELRESVTAPRITQSQIEEARELSAEYWTLYVAPYR